MLSEAKAQMPDIVTTEARKERGYRGCISRCCREEEIVGNVKVEDVRRY